MMDLVKYNDGHIILGQKIILISYVTGVCKFKGQSIVIMLEIGILSWLLNNGAQ